MEDESVILSSSSSERLNLEALSSQTKEIEDIVRSCREISEPSSAESKKLLTEYIVDLERKVKEITAESPDFSSLPSEDLDAYLRDANEELKVVVAANSKINDEIKALTSTYIEDYTRLESDLEGLGCSLKFIESQGLDALEKVSDVEGSISLEGQVELMNAYEDYNFEVLELDDKIEKKKATLRYLKDLDYSLKGVEAFGLIEDIFTSVKVIEFEGSCIRLFLKTFIPTMEDSFYKQKMDSANEYPILDHELLIEFFEGTMELKNVEIFPNDVVIDEIIDVAKSSRKLLPSFSTTETRSTLEWLVREVQNRIILSAQNRSKMKDAEKSR